MTDARPEDVLETAGRWLAEGRRVAIATVVSTWGSSPRPAGSALAVDHEGRFVGSVSGGCIEGAVVGEALAAMADGETRRLEFGVSDEQAWEVGLACGGRVEVHVEPLAGRERTLERLLAARREKRPAVLATPLEGGEPELLLAGADAGASRLGDEVAAAARAALAEDRARLVETAAGPVFVAPFNPPLRLAVVGAVHIAQTLVPLAALLGYEVTVIDPRRAFASPHRFPGVRLVDLWPDEALAEMAPDARTAIVTLTHDPKLDDPALEAALGSPAFYLACLGSTRTHAARLERLRGRGFDEAALARLHGPAGLDLGARTPGEIALSIAAEMTAALRRGGAA